MLMACEFRPFLIKPPSSLFPKCSRIVGTEIPAVGVRKSAERRFSRLSCCKSSWRKTEKHLQIQSFVGRKNWIRPK